MFLNKRRDYIKILYWDSDGLAIWCKRLEKRSFSRQDSQVFGSKTVFDPLEGNQS